MIGRSTPMQTIGIAETKKQFMKKNSLFLFYFLPIGWLSDLLNDNFQTSNVTIFFCPLFTRSTLATWIMRIMTWFRQSNSVHIYSGCTEESRKRSIYNEKISVNLQFFDAFSFTFENSFIFAQCACPGAIDLQINVALASFNAFSTKFCMCFSHKMRIWRRATSTLDAQSIHSRTAAMSCTPFHQTPVLKTTIEWGSKA